MLSLNDKIKERNMAKGCSVTSVREIVRVFAECELIEIYRHNGQDHVRFANVSNCYDIRDRMLEGTIASMRYLASISKEPDKAIREEDLHRWHDVLAAIAHSYPEFIKNYEKLEAKPIDNIRVWDDHYRKKFAS